nr:HAMP domain-containing sensor histidine kinase [bacterium]
MDRQRFIKNVLFLFALSAVLMAAALSFVVHSEYGRAREAAAVKVAALESSLAENIRRADYLRIQQLLNALLEGPAEGASLRLASDSNVFIRVGKAWPRGHEKTPLLRYEIKSREGAVLGVVTVACRYRAVAAATLSRVAPMIVALMALVLFVVVMAQLPFLLHSRRIARILRALAGYGGDPKVRDELNRMASSTGDEGVRSLISTVCGLVDKEREAAEREQETKVMCAIGSIASQVAHDIRSPLSVISAYVQRAAAANHAKGAGADEELYLGATARSVEKLMAMADELLDYARASKVDAQETDLRRYFEEHVLPEIKRAASTRSVKLSLDLPAKAQARIDGAKMGRAMVNVLQNAIQSIEHDDGEIKVLARAVRGELSIGVEDNGKGIPAEKMTKIFERFSTFGKEKGTGLGLSYCKQVIDAHGGTIDVKSECGKGTFVNIRIPNCIVDTGDSSAGGS